mmetsp:Transcript_58115/g.126367  ORF Transcript_58115/g.126367 Transcript_58115/m.126367 type:complete len:109 (-) Transcript_58115:848-1174(-)
MVSDNLTNVPLLALSRLWLPGLDDTRMIAQLVAPAVPRGVQLRFWNTADDAPFWAEQLRLADDARVTLNSNHPDAVAAFLADYASGRLHCATLRTLDHKSFCTACEPG